MRLRVSSLLALLLVGCNGQPPIPSWAPKLFLGDSKTEQLVASDGEVMSCKDPRFDNMIAMDKSEIEEQIKDRNKLIEACLQWKQ